MPVVGVSNMAGGGERGGLEMGGEGGRQKERDRSGGSEGRGGGGRDVFVCAPVLGRVG